jgi:hypothetical protein
VRTASRVSEDVSRDRVRLTTFDVGEQHSGAQRALSSLGFSLISGLLDAILDGWRLVVYRASTI